MLEKRLRDTSWKIASLGALLPDTNDLGRVFLGIGFLARRPVYYLLRLADRHDGCFFLVLDKGNTFELAFLAAHDLGEYRRLAFGVTEFVLLDEVTLVEVFHGRYQHVVVNPAFYGLAAKGVAENGLDRKAGSQVSGQAENQRNNNANHSGTLRGRDRLPDHGSGEHFGADGRLQRRNRSAGAILEADLQQVAGSHPNQILERQRRP